MPPKSKAGGRRRKAPASSADDAGKAEAVMSPSKKKSRTTAAASGDKKEEKETLPTVAELYRLCVEQEDEQQRRKMVRVWDERGAIDEIVWPFLVQNAKSNEFFHGCHLLVVFISHHCLEGSFGSEVVSCMKEQETIEQVLDTLLYKTDHKDMDYALQSAIVQFLVVSMNSDNSRLREALLSHVAGIKIWHFMSDRRRELELKKSPGLRRKFSDSEKSPVFIVNNVQHLLALLEGNSKFGQLLKLDEETEDADEMTLEIPNVVWHFIYRSLELLIDLLSVVPTRLFLVTYLDSIHFNVRCRLAVGHQFALPESLRLVQQLLSRINRLLSFPIQDASQKHLSKVDVVSMHHSRATMLQKMCHRHYSDKLQQIIYAGLGLLCARQQKHSYLERAFEGFPDEELQKLLYRMRLIASADDTLDHNFMIQVLGNFLSIPPYPMEQLKSYPLYPTETLLWDHNVIPPSRTTLRSSPVLALPKLNRQFLSYQDYLLRNFELIRLESAYEIRSDLVHVLKRVRPLLRQSNLADSEEIQLKTEFSGWSRMSLELKQPMEILQVQPPRLGETISAKVTAEFVVDLEPCGDSIRREWNEIGEFDNLFLVAVDASKMSGKPAPLLRDFHLHHGSHKQWDSDDSERRVPDEEDSTFPQRFGVTLVRGCMVLQVRNEAGTVLSDPGVDPSAFQKGTKRIFKVSLDPAQYSIDSKAPGGTDSYQQINLIVRRHGRENNFKSVLETVRGLLDGAGSIERVLPPWLQSLLLGYGDPTCASYKSEPMKSYAMKTVGVNKPTDFLNYGDTFLDQEHLRESFDCKKLTIDGEAKAKKSSKKDSSRSNFKVRCLDNGDMEAESTPCYDGVEGNSVRFTPVQVEAIRSGLSPGLTVVVGPPGTGKTDVAVQIISSLYQSYPTQRTVIITHSNAALNDIFQKVMARGDIAERYMVRLGSGEKDLETDSTHDFTKIGRVKYSLDRRMELLEEVQQMSESLGISGKAERGSDGSPAYTCETAEYFRVHHIVKRVKRFQRNLSIGTTDQTEVTGQFPFAKYFKIEGQSISWGEAKSFLARIEAVFSELAEYRPFELLRSQRQRSDYLIMKQARIVAMTCTHAAIARSHLIELGFEYDNLVMEESGQMLEIETFIPMLLQKGESDDAVSGLSRLKRVCMMGDHNQLPPVVKNASFAKYSNLDQSLFSRLIRMGVPHVQLDKQGRARAELALLYRYVHMSISPLYYFTMGTY